MLTKFQHYILSQSLFPWHTMTQDPNPQQQVSPGKSSGLGLLFINRSADARRKEGKRLWILINQAFLGEWGEKPSHHFYLLENYFHVTHFENRLRKALWLHYWPQPFLYTSLPRAETSTFHSRSVSAIDNGGCTHVLTLQSGIHLQTAFSKAVIAWVVRGMVALSLLPRRIFQLTWLAFPTYKNHTVFYKIVIKDTMLVVKCTGTPLIIRAHFQDTDPLGFIWVIAHTRVISLLA